MNKPELENWERIKEAMEASGNTNNFFYKRAVAICSGGKDPMESLPTKDVE